MVNYLDRVIGNITMEMKRMASDIDELHPPTRHHDHSWWWWGGGGGGVVVVAKMHSLLMLSFVLTGVLG